MEKNTPLVYRSMIDEERFGIRSARANSVSTEHLDYILKYCRDENIKFLIARCSCADLSATHAMEQAGFQLMDTLVYYSRNLLKTAIPEELKKAAIRFSTPEDAEMVRQVATEAFQDYYGHYHADPRLCKEQCDEAYQSWAYNSCISKEVAHAVLLAEDANQDVIGFATLRMNTAQEGEGVLFAVAPKAQGRGIYWSFIVQGMRWCKDQNAKRMVVSTQITNLSVQKVWVRCGFEPSSSYYTFHKWFD